MARTDATRKGATMATRRDDDPNADAPRPRPSSSLDPVADAIARREEEFRRFLVSVVGPAFDELRAAFKADGHEVRVGRPPVTGRLGEATIAVRREGQADFEYTVAAAIVPERAVVVKRRTVPDPGGGAGATRFEATPLVAGTAHASDARTVTRADVVASVRADYRALRRRPTDD